MSEHSEAWERLRWVEDLKDPSLRFDDLHQSFEEIVFGLPVLESDDEKSADEEDAELDDDMADAMRDLSDTGRSNADEQDEGSDVFDNISEEEEREREQMEEDLVAGGWQDWLSGRRKRETPAVTNAGASQRIVEVELGRVGLGEQDMIVKNDILPERYKVIAMEEKRDMLGPKHVKNNFGSSIDIHQEAVWVLHQLRRPGQPFARSEVAAEIVAKSYDKLLQDPLVNAIAYALKKMTTEYLEPAHLMMYHQTPLMPLLHALWTRSVELTQFNTNTVNPSFAYCTTTGRRQRPLIKVEATTFELSTNSGPQQRKPCILELGRLLYAILELDIVCHRLEHSRQVLLLSLKNHIEPSRLLSDRVFEHKTEADMWGAYATFLVDTTVGRSATHRIKQLDLESIFEDYSITGAQYHENLCHGTGTFTCRQHTGEDVYRWFNEHAENLDRSMNGEQLIDLFNRSIVEQFSKLPTLRRRVFDAFCSDGELVVTSITATQKAPSSMNISTLLDENTQMYFDLLQQERNGTVQLDLVLDERVIRNIFNVRELYDATTDSWSSVRNKAIDATVMKLVKITRRDVRSALRSAAEAAGQKIASTRLGIMCSEGPYDQTQLAIEGVDASRRTWDGAWNSLESLPVNKVRRSFERARVCSAFRGENGVTCFACIDTDGNVCSFARWADVPTGSDAGNVAHLANLQALKMLLQEHAPTVIAVAAQKQSSMQLFQTLEKFIQQEVKNGELMFIPVVWTTPAVAIAYTYSSSADTEMGNRDPVTRSAVSLARFIQDPLFEMCQLFDAKQSVLLLPLGAHNQVSKGRLMRGLAAEMMLWVAAVGVNLQEVLRWSNPKSILQFVPGLGPLKATMFVDQLRQVNLENRRQVQQLLESNFGTYIAVNATATLRLHAEEDSEVVFDDLDKTLIPLPWYPAVKVMAACMIPSPSKEISFDHMLLQDRSQLRSAFSSLNVPLFLAQLNDLYPDLGIGVVEAHFLADEILALGQSFMRRPYRHLTTKSVFRLLTGVVVATERDAVSASDEFVTLRYGDVVQGIIAGPRLGRAEFGSSDGLRVTTSHGISAFIAGIHISDQSVLKELAEYRIAVEESRRQPFGSTGKLVYGAIVGCNWEKCELRLVWSATPPPTSEVSGSAPSFARMLGENRSVNSVLTKEILDAAIVNSMKVSRHSLFKNVTRQRASELLRDKYIGEILIRGSSRKNYATICVKIGNTMVANWPVKEIRNSAGQCRYTIDHRRVGGKYEFAEMDQCLEQFIRPTIETVKGLRNHRKFVSDPRDIRPRLEEEAMRSGGFAYAFAEGNDEENPPTFYKVYYRFNGSDKTLKLHVDGGSLFVRLPDRQGNSEWFPCKNAEVVSIALKNWMAEVVRGSTK